MQLFVLWISIANYYMGLLNLHINDTWAPNVSLHSFNFNQLKRNKKEYLYHWYATIVKKIK